jgi:hypothetical protein
MDTEHTPNDHEGYLRTLEDLVPAIIRTLATGDDTVRARIDAVVQRLNDATHLRNLSGTVMRVRARYEQLASANTSEDNERIADFLAAADAMLLKPR